MKGIYSALLTPFDREGSINENGLREIINHNIETMKVDGLYVCGSTGENFMLSTDEKKKIFHIVKDEVGDRINLIAQVGSVNIRESIELARYTTSIGYECLSAVTPFYYKFDFEEIKNYYDEIVDKSGNKMIVYSIPALTGVSMNLDNFGELFENKNIIGVKLTNADFYLLERIRKKFKDKIIFSGFDEMFLPALSLGVDGAIGSTFNINGIRVRKMLELFNENNIKEARDIQHITNDLITEILDNGIYQTIKLILQEFKIDAGYCRKPFKEPSDEMKLRAKEIFLKYFVS